MNINHSRIKGVSLIEVLTTISMIAIGLTLALPSWEYSRNKRHLTGTTEQLAGFFTNAQSVAIKHNDRLTVNLMQSTSVDWCVGAVLGDIACDCTESDLTSESYCDIDGAPWVLGNGSFKLSEMSAHSPDTTFTFEPVRGLMVSEDLGLKHFFNLVSENDHFGLQVTVRPTGLVHVCSFDAAREVPGYAECSASLNTGIGG